MLTAFVALPMAARIALVAIVAIIVARFINWAIYNWSYKKRSSGPWADAPKGCAAHRLADHIPVLGWLRLARESQHFGRLFWLRPLLIELVFPIVLSWYYHFYVSGGALGIRPQAAAFQPQFHTQFMGHFVLLALMTIATFIDFDEFSIPDFVTVPGTVIGLAGAAFGIAWLPFDISGPVLIELDAMSPAVWPMWMNGQSGLILALAIILIWGFALLERRWITRRGFGKAIQYFFARLFRIRGVWVSVIGVSVLLAIGVTAVWWLQWNRWPYLLSSLLGLAFAGGITWGVRISATMGLGIEALGFGDVTLMAMIGTFIGWQPSLVVFFLAPMVAILFVLIRRIVTGESETPYGPYLCAATVLLLLFWKQLWIDWASAVFAIGPEVILGIVVACVFLMGGMLWIWRLIKQALGISVGH